MKWPNYIALVRHDVSAYNELKELKEKSEVYQSFLKRYEKEPDSPVTKNLAKEALKEICLNCGDHNTQLALGQGLKSEETGRKLKELIDIPDIIVVSPYVRTLDTFACMKRGWPELSGVKVYEDERLREREHGLSIIYNDWRIFLALHPEQGTLHDAEGRYYYRFPQGENIPDVRSRNRSWTTTVIREFSGKNVLVITHHISILSMRANFERLNAEEFLRLDEHEKPINCGVTLYKGIPRRGTQGKLELAFYNRKLY